MRKPMYVPWFGKIPWPRRPAAPRAIPKTPISFDTLWYQDTLPFPMPVCVISSMDATGNHNVAPCSSVFPWCADGDRPQIVVVTRRSARTSRNILATGEFTLNFMGAAQLARVVQAGAPYPGDVDKLARSGWTFEPSVTNATQRIIEASYVLECRLAASHQPSPEGLNLVADVTHGEIDAALAGLEKQKRLGQARLATYYGFEEGQYVFGVQPSVVRFAALTADDRYDQLPWDPDALAILENVPHLVRSTARRAIERRLREQGAERITANEVHRLRREMGR